MKYQLIYFPNQFLLKPTTKVEVFNDELFEILDCMHHEIDKHRGLGLAANQVGVSISLFLLRTQNDVVEIINPEIISESGHQIFNNEGCLSAPGIFVPTQRPQQIHFKYQDRFGQPKESIVEGIEAVCFSHEMTHLKGELFISAAISRQQKRFALKKLGMR